MSPKRLAQSTVAALGLLMVRQGVAWTFPLVLPVGVRRTQQPAQPQEERSQASGPAKIKLIKRVDPVYPQLALRARVEGEVFLEVRIDEQGKVSRVDVLRGHPLLNQAAVDAVSQWIYAPTLLNGKPVSAVATVTVNFHFADDEGDPGVPPISGLPPGPSALDQSADVRKQPQVDPNELARETQRRFDQSFRETRMLWWIPTEYWEESFKKLPAVTQGHREFLKALDDFFVLAVVDQKMSASGALISKSRKEIAAALSISVLEGAKARPLQDSDLPPKMIYFLTFLKTHMGSMLGEFGEGMEFFLFAGRDDHGNRVVNPREAGSFSVEYGNHTFEWHLPLVCLLPPRFDPETGEQFPGNYLYNPFTGKRLISSKPPD